MRSFSDGFIIQFKNQPIQMKTTIPMRETSSKTLSRTRVQMIDRGQLQKQTNRIIRSKVGTSYIQDSIIYKNMKLSTMVENLASFANCLQDIKWIFEQSFCLFNEFLKNTKQLYPNEPSKSLSIGNIAKQYATLKKRFDMIDLGDIRNIVASYAASTTNSQNVPELLHSVGGEPPKRKGSVMLINSRNMSKQVNQQNYFWRGKVEQLQKTNIDQSKKIDQLRSEIGEMRKNIVQHVRQKQQIKGMLFNKVENEISTISKLKLAARKLRQMNQKVHDKELQLQYIDALVFNLSTFQQRLRDELRAATSQQISVEELSIKKNMLQGQIRSLVLQLDNLRDEKAGIQKYVDELQQVANKKSSSPEFEISNYTEMCFLALQASAIQKLL